MLSKLSVGLPAILSVQNLKLSFLQIEFLFTPMQILLQTNDKQSLISVPNADFIFSSVIRNMLQHDQRTKNRWCSFRMTRETRMIWFVSSRLK